MKHIINRWTLRIKQMHGISYAWKAILFKSKKRLWRRSKIISIAKKFINECTIPIDLNIWYTATGKKLKIQFFS